MIVVSLLLIAVAVVLLAVGLWQPSSALLSGSIAASLFAAIALVAGARRSAVPEVASEREPGRPRGGGADTAPLRAVSDPEPDLLAEARPAGADRPDQAGSEGPAPLVVEPATTAIPTQGGPARAEAESGDGYDDEDPPDEPAPQQVSPADAARVRQMATDVLVVDGRPRYHLPGCVHLLGREHEPLPVSEAVELGFTPCSLCEPDSALLADARRV